MADGPRPCVNEVEGVRCYHDEASHHLASEMVENPKGGAWSTRLVRTTCLVGGCKCLRFKRSP